MKEKPDENQGNNPLFIEAPKPVNQMTQEEKEAFADEILGAIPGQASRTACPKCSSKDGLREIMYGLPIGPVDEQKYAIGGCCISDNDPTVKCIECGWKGDFVNHINRMYAIDEEKRLK